MITFSICLFVVILGYFVYGRVIEKILGVIMGAKFGTASLGITIIFFY